MNPLTTRLAVAAAAILAWQGCISSGPGWNAREAHPEQYQRQGTGIGVSAGVGTDVTLGVGAGLSVNKIIHALAGPSFDLELGGQLFYAKSSETTDEEINSYDETTEVTIIAVRANALFGYRPRQTGVYYSAGAGAAAVNVYWEERSDTDTSLGTPLDGGGSMQDEEGLAAGLIASGGLGFTFGGGFDLRLELPLIIILGEVGEASSIIPTITAFATYRF